MPITSTRRDVLLLIGASPLLSVPAFASEEGYATDDVIYGDKDAALTVYEYVSYTCPHCSSFHINIWPQIKEAYVDTGKVKFVVRDFYRNQADLLVGMTARCGGEKGFYPMADAFLSTQSTWMRAPDVNQAIRQIARKAGLPNSRIDKCLTDEEYAKTLATSWQKNMEEHSVRATPSFVIGGETHSGIDSYDAFAKLIDAALET